MIKSVTLYIQIKCSSCPEKMLANKQVFFKKMEFGTRLHVTVAGFSPKRCRPVRLSYFLMPDSIPSVSLNVN